MRSAWQTRTSTSSARSSLVSSVVEDTSLCDHFTLLLMLFTFVSDETVSDHAAAQTGRMRARLCRTALEISKFESAQSKVNDTLPILFSASWMK